MSVIYSNVISIFLSFLSSFFFFLVYFYFIILALHDHSWLICKTNKSGAEQGIFDRTGSNGNFTQQKYFMVLMSLSLSVLQGWFFSTPLELHSISKQD